MNIKKGILFICLFVASTSFVKAQENKAFEAETITFLKLTGAGAAFEQVVTQLGAMVKEENKESYAKEAAESVDVLYTKMAAMYMEEFTEAEIKELVKFYNSDLGKKMASKQMMLMQKGMALGQNWGMELQQIAQKYQ